MFNQRAKVNLHHNARKTLFEHRLSAACFLRYGLLHIKEDVRSSDPDCPHSWSVARIILFVIFTASSRQRCVVKIREFAWPFQSVKLVKWLSNLRTQRPTCIWCLAELMSVKVKHVICTKDIFRIIEFHVENFWLMRDGLDQMAQRIRSQMTVSKKEQT